MGAPKLEVTFFDKVVLDAFIDATKKTISTYFGGQNPVKQNHNMGQGIKVDYAIAGVVKFQTPDVNGTLLVAFENRFILKVFESMLGEKADSINKDVEDCVGELTNILYGFAKSHLGNLGYQCSMARPFVTREPNKELLNLKALEMTFKITKDKELSLILCI